MWGGHGRRHAFGEVPARIAATLSTSRGNRRLASRIVVVAAVALAVCASSAAAQSTATCTLNLVCEAETGTLHDGAGTEDEHAGYTGTGFVDQLFGAAGVKLTVNADRGDSHRITVRYANANPGTGVASRRFTVTVNGTTDVPVLFPADGKLGDMGDRDGARAVDSRPQRARLPDRPRQQRADQHRPHHRPSPATTITEDGVTLRLFNIDTRARRVVRPQARPDPERRRAAADHRLDDRRRLGELLDQLSRAGRRRPRRRAGRLLHVPAPQRRRIEAP